MAIIPKQDVAFFFGDVNQGKGKRNLRAGELIEALNVRQIVDDEYRKRPGFDRVVPTPDTGSFTASGESFVSDGRSQLARDGADQVWARSSSTWNTRGTVKRASTTLRTGKTVPSVQRQTMILVGSQYWVFAMSTTNTYQWQILDATGNVVKPLVSQTATGVIAMAAETDGTYVYVVWTTNGGSSVFCHRFTVASPTTAPTLTTYLTMSGGNNANGVDMQRLSSGDIAVAITGGGSGNVNLNVSYVNTTAGAGTAKTSPAAVQTQMGATAGGFALMQAPTILTSQGTSTWSIAFWQGRTGLITSGNTTQANLTLVDITTTTLAVAATKSIATGDDSTSGLVGYVSGYVATNGDRVLFSSYANTSTHPLPYVLTKYSWTGSVLTTTVLRNYGYPLSKPQVIGSTWYLLTGYDDAATTAAFLRSYYLIDSSGNIIDQFAYSLGAPAGNVTTLVTLLNTGNTAPTVTALRASASGSKLEACVLVNTGSGGGAAGVNDFGPAFVSLDLAATYSAPVRVRDGMAIWPGGVPLMAGTADNQHEAALMLSPPPATFTQGTTLLAGPQVVQYLYRITDVDGTIYRSAPSVAQSQTFGTTGPAIIVKPLTHLMPGVTATIEIYISAVNATQPYLHAVVANDQTVLTITTTPTPGTITTTNPTLYTYGNGLPNFPLPSSLCVTTFKNRTIVATGSDMWPSQERSALLGPQWNSALVSTWDDGEGDIIAMCPVDWNYLALFKRNAIAVVTGSGPRQTAGGGVSGNYEFQTLKVSKGQLNTRSVQRGPGGCYFQSSADGRIYCVTPALEIADLSRGMEAYTSETVVATNFVEKNRQMHFHMSSGAIMVLDYAHPTPEQPFGTWVRWTSTGLAAACGATVDTTGVPVHLEAVSGAIRTPGTAWTDATSGAGADILMSLTTGDLAAAGQLRGAFRLDAVTLLGEWIATNTPKITVSSDYQAITTTHTSAAITAGPQECYVRPTGHDRAQSVRVKVEEITSTGEGFIFTGLALTVQMLGRGKFPNNTRRVS